MLYSKALAVWDWQLLNTHSIQQCFWLDHHRKFLPLHVRYKKAQLVQLTLFWFANNNFATIPTCHLPINIDSHSDPIKENNTRASEKWDKLMEIPLECSHIHQSLVPSWFLIHSGESAHIFSHQLCVCFNRFCGSIWTSFYFFKVPSRILFHVGYSWYFSLLQFLLPYLFLCLFLLSHSPSLR